MDLRTLRETNKRRALKIKKRKQEKASENDDSKTNKTGTTSTPKSKVELLTKTEQVIITIKDNE
jgi:hypothetical protein